MIKIQTTARSMKRQFEGQIEFGYGHERMGEDRWSELPKKRK